MIKVYLEITQGHINPILSLNCVEKSDEYRDTRILAKSVLTPWTRVEEMNSIEIVTVL